MVSARSRTLRGGITLRDGARRSCPRGWARPAEPIVRQDGERKNECERRALKRLLKKGRRISPRRGLKLRAVRDGLEGEGETLKSLKAWGLSSLIVVKAGAHAALFEAVQRAWQAGKTDEVDYHDAQGVRGGFRSLNGVPLNPRPPEILVNDVDDGERGKDGKEYPCRGIPDIPWSRQTGEPVMRGGRARWKIANETFTTLKKQGDAFEHH